MNTKQRQASQENSRFSLNGAAKFSFDQTQPDAKIRKFGGVGYSGDVITDHWYWDDVVFDLSTTTMSDKVPCLVDHNPDKRAGFTTSNAIDLNTGVSVEGVLLKSEDGARVASDSDDGFPWQMSVQIEPGSIEEVGKDVTIVVNNRTFTGPITVFRQNKIVELSFCSLGWDSQTSATAMSRKDLDKKDGDMDIKELQAQLDAANKANADLKALSDKAVSDLAAFSRATRENEVKTLFAEVGKEVKDDAEYKAFVEMDASAFSVVSATLRSVKPTALNPALFSHQAIADGAAPEAENPLIANARKQAQEFSKRFAA
jgi:hypothetical protein